MSDFIPSSLEQRSAMTAPDKPATVVTEVLADGSTSKRSQELHWGSIGSSGSHDASVLHAALGVKVLHNLGDSGALLADSDVDAVKLVRLGGTRSEARLLVDDGIESDGSLASLAVTNDQLTLTTTDRHQHIDSLHA